jgi:centromere protein X
MENEEERPRQRPKTTQGRSKRGEFEEEEIPPEKTIPKELLTRLLHEFFAKDATRLSRDANAAVGKYVDVFVREAIARTAVEKQGGFLEVSWLCALSCGQEASPDSREQVEDLEKVTPQLLLDL